MARGGVSPRSLLFRIGAVGAIIGVIFIAGGPYRGRFISQARDLIPIDRHRAIPTQEWSVRSSSPEGDLAGRPVENLTDTFLNTSWATTWNGVGSGLAEADEVCRPGEATDTFLIVDFGEPRDVDRIRMVPGLWEDHPDTDARRRPVVVEVRYPDGTCDNVVFEDSGVMQEASITGDDIATLELRVVGVSDVATSTEVSISELRFDRRR
jgi:hypothetical protein